MKTVELNHSIDEDGKAVFTVTNEKNLDNYFSQPKVKEELKELFKECNKLHDRRRFPHEEVMNKEFNAVA